MFFLAIKHLVNRPHQTLLTILGVTLGAAGYIVFSGLQIGYNDYVIDRLVNMDAYIRISPRDEFITKNTFKDIFFTDSIIKWITPPAGRLQNKTLNNVQAWYNKFDKDPRVIAYSPQFTRGVIFNQGKFIVTGNLIGINPMTQAKVSNIEGDIIAGKLSSISQESLVLVGEDLMKNLGARLNDTIYVISEKGKIFPLKIVCVYNTGIKQFDTRIAYASISTVQKITESPGEISDIVVRVKDPYIAAPIATEWSMHAEDKVQSWDQAKEDVRVTLKTQTIVRNITTFTIMLIVSFGIYNILNMVVNQKKREIAILRSIGYDEKDTIFLFLIQGLIVGISGSIFGILLGYLACAYIETIKIDVGKGHMLISWDIFIYINAFLIVLISSTISSIIPARNAGRLSPIDIIRDSA